MTNGAVLAGTVHPLKDQQQRVSIARIEKLLQRTQLLHVLEEKLLILLGRLVIGIDNRRPLAEVDTLPWRYTEIP
jgi:hypothetical protein